MKIFLLHTEKILSLYSFRVPSPLNVAQFFHFDHTDHLFTKNHWNHSKTFLYLKHYSTFSKICDWPIVKIHPNCMSVDSLCESSDCTIAYLEFFFNRTESVWTFMYLDEIQNKHYEFPIPIFRKQNIHILLIMFIN